MIIGFERIDIKYDRALIREVLLRTLEMGIFKQFIILKLAKASYLS